MAGMATHELKRVGGVDGLEGRVGRLEVVRPCASLAQGLDCELPVDDGHDDVAGGGGAVVLDNDQVTVKDAGVLHAVAADLVHGGPGWVVDEVVVQSDELRLFLCCWLG